ncbi:MAG: hypothetical protein R2761_15690 [Acidimicrobiales bacterium]
MSATSETYITALDLERLAAMLARALGVTFEGHHSVIDGAYFRALSEDPVIELRMNYAEDGEVVHPELPEGVFVTVEGTPGTPLRETLAGLRYLSPVS